jgi:hypothetical protein
VARGLQAGVVGKHRPHAERHQGRSGHGCAPCALGRQAMRARRRCAAAIAPVNLSA